MNKIKLKRGNETSKADRTTPRNSDNSPLRVSAAHRNHLIHTQRDTTLVYQPLHGNNTRELCRAGALIRHATKRRFAVFPGHHAG